MSLLLFALDVFSPSRGTYVQLRGEENAILHQSHKPVVAISAQERAKSDIAKQEKFWSSFFKSLWGVRGKAP